MADFDAVIAAGAGTALWICVGWLLLGLATAALAELPGAVGAVCAAVSCRISPPLVRRAARGTVGVVLAAGSVLGVGAAADPDGLPGLDRPVAPPTELPIRTAPPAPAREPVGTATPAPAREPVSPATPSKTPVARVVVVERGDTLWAIAADQLGPGAGNGDIAKQWPRWYQANRAVVGPDPDLIHPGQRLVVPAQRSAPPDCG